MLARVPFLTWILLLLKPMIAVTLQGNCLCHLAGESWKQC